MNPVTTTVSRFFRCAAFLLASAMGVFGAEPTAPTVPAPAAPGLGVALNTGGFSFVQPGGKVRRPESFSASAVVTNRSRKPVSYTFSSYFAATERIIFRVINAEGQQMWSSATVSSYIGVRDTLDSESFWWSDTLAPGKAWRRNVRVPLTSLAPGRYTLEASLEGEEAVGSSTIFEVLAAQPVTPKDGTVLGWVWDAQTTLQDGVWTTVSAIRGGEPVKLTQQLPRPLRGAAPAPLVWNGITDAAGKFQAQVPAGRYQIKCGVQPAVPPGQFIITRNDGFRRPTTVKSRETARPVVMMGTEDANYPLDATIRQLTVQEDATDPTRLEIQMETSVTNISGGGASAFILEASHIAEDGLLVLDFLGRPPVPVKDQWIGQQLAIHTMKVRMAASIPKLPDVRGIRVQTVYGKSREAWLP